MSRMTAESSLLFGLSAAMSWFFGLAVQITFLVVIASVVRRNRPDVAPILFGAVIFELLVTTCAYASSFVLARFVMGVAGMQGYARAQAISTMVFGGAHAAARALLIWGIVRLARPVSTA